MQKIKILKTIGKNILIFIGGSVLGVIVMLIFIFPRVIAGLADKDPLAGIILAPLILIIYGVLSIVAGGFGAVIIYNVAKLISRRKKGVNK